MEFFLQLPEWTQGIIIAAVLTIIALLVLLYRISNQKNRMLANFISVEKDNAVAEVELAQHAEKIEELKQLCENNQQALKHRDDAYLREVNSLKQVLAEKERQLGEYSEKISQAAEIKKEIEQVKQVNQASILENQMLKQNLAAEKTSIQKEREHMAEKLALLESSEKRLATEFENIANKIFEKKSENFNKNSSTRLDQLLSPLKNQLDDFKKQVNEHYVSEGKERASLRTEISSLKRLNQQITEEAAALTQALKGDTKTQGNWGEIVLERLLEESGLRKGFEYDIQVSAKNEEQQRFYPDVVVHLPNKKDVIIDSKVSLVAFERLSSTDDPEEYKAAQKAHILSLKNHIKNLSKKDYQNLEGLRTLDYVLMFVPIESAFLAAVEAEPDLIKLALENQIMMVSPTNLLVALRTIHNIWQYEYQHENAAKIAENAKKLYDKFVGFLDDMKKIGKQLDTASGAYESALSKLHSGRGNIIRQLENFKTLGVSPTKKIDSKFVDSEEMDETEDNQDDVAN